MLNYRTLNWHAIPHLNQLHFNNVRSKEEWEDKVEAFSL